MGMSEKELQELKLAALLHDVGKIGISDAILGKPGRLTEQEFYTVKKHSEIGYRILKSTSNFSDIAEIVLAHHECVDGSGYPRGLIGAQIPLEARMLNICDAYEAMINDRPYRKAYEEYEVIKELRRCSGTQFDNLLVEIFINKVIKAGH